MIMKRLVLIFVLINSALCLNHLWSQNGSNDILDSKEVPFEMIKNAIVIPVQIDGTTYKFVLDTGGLFTISKKLQQQYPFTKTGQIDISDVNNKELAFDMVKVDEIRLGELSFIDREAIVSFDNEEYPNNCFGTEGMIGRDFFGDMILHFDYAKRVIRLTNDENAIPLNDQHKAALQLSNRGLPDVLIPVDGKSEYIEFDSGSGDFFSYKSKDAKRSDKNDRLTFQGIFSFGVSSRKVKSSKRYKNKIKSLKLGSTEFNNFYSDFSKTSAPRIGASILYYGRVTVDYKNLAFYFEPYPDKPSLPTLKSFGFDIVYLNGEYLVKWVIKKSTAQKSGLKFGLKVKSIDGIPIAQVAKECEGYIHGYPYYQKDKIVLEYFNAKGKLTSIELKNETY
jgi:hypothetical protein